jgi:hypothetical protein
MSEALVFLLLKEKVKKPLDLSVAASNGVKDC